MASSQPDLISDIFVYWEESDIFVYWVLSTVTEHCHIHPKKKLNKTTRKYSIVLRDLTIKKWINSKVQALKKALKISPVLRYLSGE